MIDKEELSDNGEARGSHAVAAPGGDGQRYR